MSIKRGDRMFVQLAAIGECDESGKVALKMGYKGKIVAEPDRPLSTLAIGIVEQILCLARYSGEDALRRDLATFLEYVGTLEPRVGAAPEEGGAP